MPEDGIVVDANIINSYIQSVIVDNGDNKVIKLLSKIMSKYGFLINDVIEHEWKENLRSFQYFEEWFTQCIIEEKIGYVEYINKLTTKQKKDIFIVYGLPTRGCDIEYIKCTLNTRMKYLLTEDIHFYDPKKRMANKTEKKKIKGRREGCFCKYLKKEMGLTVGSCDHCESDLIL